VGIKKKYRIVLFNRVCFSGIVEFIEHDPYRSANICRVYSNIENLHCYILAPLGLARGHYINSQIDDGSKNFKIGNLFHLQDLPLGVFVHNVLLSVKKIYSKILKVLFIRTIGFIRAAGCSAHLISKDTIYCRLRLASGEHRLFSSKTNVTLGILSNPLQNRIVIGKAGRSRWLNSRPTVRGVAMNPIDHPGRPSVSPWGGAIRGQPTRKTAILPLIIKKRKK